MEEKTVYTFLVEIQISELPEGFSDWPDENEDYIEDGFAIYVTNMCGVGAVNLFDDITFGDMLLDGGKDFSASELYNGSGEPIVTVWSVTYSPDYFGDIDEVFTYHGVTDSFKWTPEMFIKGEGDNE